MKKDQVIEKTALLGALHVNRQALIDCAWSWPVERVDEIFLGKWSLLDLLAHLSGWDEANFAAVDAVQAGKLPEYYVHHDADWRKFNRIMVGIFRQPTLELQIERVKKTFEPLQRRLADLEEEVFYKDFGVRFRGYKVIIARLIESELKDEREHLVQMRDWLNSA